MESERHYYPIWVSPKAISVAIQHLEQQKSLLGEDRYKFCAMIFKILEDGEDISISSESDNLEKIEFLVNVNTYGDVVDHATGIFILKLLNYDLGSWTSYGANIYKILKSRKAVVLDPGNKDVAMFIGTEHIPR
jgi:hypothetical protein